MEIWLITHWIEITGTIFALIYLFFSINEKVWLWPTGFITSFFYLIVFFNSRFYADMALQLYYMAVSVYGWYHWIGKPKFKSNDEIIKTKKLNFFQWLYYITGIIILNLVIYYLLLFLPLYLGLPAPEMPFLDAFTTAASIIATYLLARKILENWILWIIIDAVSMSMYFYKGLYVTTFLFMVYTGLAIVGYIKWKRNMKVI